MWFKHPNLGYNLIALIEYLRIFPKADIVSENPPRRYSFLVHCAQDSEGIALDIVIKHHLEREGVFRNIGFSFRTISLLIAVEMAIDRGVVRGSIAGQLSLLVKFSSVHNSRTSLSDQISDGQVAQVNFLLYESGFVLIVSEETPLEFGYGIL